MGKRLALTFLLTITANSHSGAEPSPYVAVYQGAYYGISIEATRTFSCTNESSVTTCDLRSKAEAALGTIEEHSRFTLYENTPTSLEYNYNQAFMFSSRERSIQFDHAAGIGYYNDRNGAKEIPLEHDYFDTLNYQFALGQAAVRGDTLIDLPVLRRGKPADWTFSLVSEESVNIGEDTYQSRHYERLTDESDKAVDIWLSPEHNGLLLKLVYTEDGKSHTLNLVEYATPPVAG